MQELTFLKLPGSFPAHYYVKEINKKDKKNCLRRKVKEKNYSVCECFMAVS